MRKTREVLLKHHYAAAKNSVDVDQVLLDV